MSCFSRVLMIAHAVRHPHNLIPSHLFRYCKASIFSGREYEKWIIPSISVHLIFHEALFYLRIDFKYYFQIEVKSKSFQLFNILFPKNENYYIFFNVKQTIASLIIYSWFLLTHFMFHSWNSWSQWMKIDF